LLLFNRILIGLGYGVEESVFVQELDFPVYFNFRYYFKLKNHDIFTPFINCNIGAIINTTYCNRFIQLESPGVFATIMGGFKIGKFQVSCGLNFRTEKNMEYIETSMWIPWEPMRKGIGLDWVVRVGLIF
jgi:hypothetical protein